MPAALDGDHARRFAEVSVGVPRVQAHDRGLVPLKVAGA